MKIDNQTPYAAMLVPHYDAEGLEVAACVVKGTFRLEDGTPPEACAADEQCPITLADEYWGEPGESVLKAESDLAPFKPTTDVILLGFAYDARMRATRKQAVSLALGPVKKRSEVAAGEAADRLPLTLLEPVGVEKRWLRTPRPKRGFGFFPRCYEPRVRYAGTYDDAWEKERSPFLPADFDYRFFQSAYPDLVCPSHLRGDEAISLTGVTPSGRLVSHLPGLGLDVQAFYEDGERSASAALDTVVLEPEEKRASLVWRCMFPCNGSFQSLLGVRVRERKARTGA